MLHSLKGFIADTYGLFFHPHISLNMSWSCVVDTKLMNLNCQFNRIPASNISIMNAFFFEICAIELGCEWIKCCSGKCASHKNFFSDKFRCWKLCSCDCLLRWKRDMRNFVQKIGLAYKPITRSIISFIFSCWREVHPFTHPSANIPVRPKNINLKNLRNAKCSYLYL